MNKFTQHIPNFVDDDNPVVIEFDTTVELLTNRFFNRWNTNDFMGFRYNTFLKALIVLTREPNGKNSWWVVGYTESPLTDLQEFYIPDKE